MTATFTWIDGTSGDWGTSTDWSPTGVPDATSDASFVGSGTETVTVSSNEAVNQLTLDNAGTTLTVQDSATLTVYGGLVATAGHLNLVGNSVQAVVDVLAPAGFGTPGVLTGNISLGDGAHPTNALLEFSSGQITDIAQYGSLLLYGPNALVADAGSLTTNSALQGLSTVEGTFELLGGGTLQTTGNLTNSGIFWAIGDYFNDGKTGAVTIGGTITNSGTVSVGDGTTVTATGFNNTGNLQIATSFGQQATLDITGPAGFGTAGVVTGNVQLEGSNAVLEFASGQITDIAAGAQLGIGGPSDFVEDATSPGSNSALQGLSTVEGSFQLIGGTVATTGGLTNSGSVQVEDSGSTIGSLSIGGTLTNSGAITDGGQAPGGTISATGLNNQSTGTIVIAGAPGQLAALNISGAATNDGTLTAQYGTVDLQGPVSGSGSAVIEYGSTLEFGSSVASTERVTFNNGGSFDYTLKIDQPGQFSGIISGFGSSPSGNDIVELANAASATPVSYSGGLTTLEVKDAASNVIANLRLLGDYTGYTFNVSGNNVTTNAAAPPPPADDTPSLTVPGAQTVTVGNALGISGSVVDPDADNFGERFTVQVSHSANNGTDFTMLPEGATVTGSGTNIVTVTGTLAQVNAALATLAYASNNPGVQPGTDTITFQVTDSDGGTDTKTVAVNLVSDPDAGEQAALGLTVSGNSTTPIGSTGAGTVAFTVAGLDPEDTGTVTFTDINNKTVTVNVTGGQTNYSANLTSLADGAITSSLAVATDPAGNSFTPVAGNAVSLDQDTGEQAALTLTVNGSSATPVGSAGAGTVAFTVSGLDSEDSGTVTFTDVNNKTVVVNVTGGQTTYSANLASLADGTVTSSLAVAADPAGNTFTPVAGNAETLDQDSGAGQFLLLNSSFGPQTLTADTNTGLEWLNVGLTAGQSYDAVSSQLGAGQLYAGYRYATAAEVQQLWADFGITANPAAGVALLEADLGVGDVWPTGSREVYGLTADTVSPGTHEAAFWATNNPSYGSTAFLLSAPGQQAPDTAGYLPYGAPYTSLLVRQGPVASGQAAHSLTVNGNAAAPIGSAGAGAVAFTVAGLDPEDSGTVTFTDVNNKTVVVSVSGGQTAYTANLTTLADGSITSTLAVATDPAGNSFTAVAGNAASLDQTAPQVTEGLANDTGISSTDKITNNDTLTGSGDPNAVVHFTVDGTPIAQTATANASGNWTFAPTGLADGSHTVVASETDAAGNTGTASLTFTLDTTAPELVSFNRAGSSGPTNAGQVSYSVTFSEPVTGVDASQFQVDPASTVNGASIAAVTEIDATHYSVAVNTGSGDGTVGIDLVGTGIDDLAGNPLPGGQFKPQVTLPTAAGPLFPVIADVNGDGKADIIVSDLNADTISVLLGNGDGTFQTAHQYVASAYSLTVGDLTGNGKEDIVAADPGGGVSVLMGNGDGTFQSPVHYAGGGNDETVSIGDLNGDGKADLILADNAGGVVTLLGNGDGTFQPYKEIATGGETTSVAVGDLNGDGKLDVVSSNFGTNDIAVLLGNGDGTFQPQVHVGSGNRPNSVHLVDLNGDGKLDLVWVNEGSGTVSVMLGNGDGTFQKETDYAAGAGARTVTIVDLNGDGKLDLAVANQGGNSVSVLYGNGDGTFQNQVTYAAGTQTYGIAAGDLNGDGRPDLVAANLGGNDLSLFFNTPPAIPGPTYTIDKTPPQATVSLDHSTVNLAAETAVVTFAFSEAVTGFGLSSVTENGGSLSNLQTSDGGKTYTATFTATNGIDISNADVAVNANGYQDLAGNEGGAASTGSFTVDTVAPSVSATTNNSDVNLAHGTATVTFSFSEAPTDFSLAHVSATGGTLSNLQQVNATTYTATFTGSAATDIGTASVAVDNAWHENNGNAGTSGRTASFVVDTVTPSVAVSINNSHLTLSARTATVTFSFSEAPVSFVLADTAAVGGALSNLQKVNATTYTATFTAAANTLISNASVSVAGSSWQEGNGNPGAGGATASFIVDTLDHWTNAAGGSWSTASNWGNGVPAAGVAADIDRSGTYTLTISGAAATYGLLVNDAGATVSDNKNGALALAGTGGSNGALTISAGTFALAGGSLAAGSILIASGGVLQISQSYALAETITDNGAITLASATSKGITATFNGGLGGSGKVTVQNGATAVIGTAVIGPGSFTLANTGNLEFASSDTENVTFAAGATGTLKLDHSLTGPFTGKISGLTPNNAVDLADLSFVKGKTTAVYTGTTAGGTLKISNGTQSVSLSLVGDYTHSTWKLSKDSSGTGTLVIDPSAAPAPPLVASVPESRGPDLALLVNYMASAFPQGGHGLGSSLIGDASLAAISQQGFLAQPHHA